MLLNAITRSVRRLTAGATLPVSLLFSPLFFFSVQAHAQQAVAQPAPAPTALPQSDSAQPAENIAVQSIAVQSSAPRLAGELQSRQLQSKFGSVSVEALTQKNDDGSVNSRQFVLKTGPATAPVEKTISPASTDALLISKNPLFDAAFALSQLERQQNSVSEITDWGFNDQQALPCPCFETGAKWHYVWTRDLSYALDLGLSALDPERAQTSLLFKTSQVRPELIARGVENTEVALQDTGSGGSWPVSSDRVVWVLAASGMTAQDPEGASNQAAAEAWQQRWYAIARNTILQDRSYIFDTKLGLYRGETSFLDWREQSYPSWTAKDTLFLAESFSLSTNVLHYVALSRAAEAAKTQEPARAAELAQWAQALKQAINSWFWLPEKGLYARYIGEVYNPVAVEHYDLLGLALAITHGVASPLQAQQILQNYPLTQAGPPVIFPALPDVPIYHNRAIWPFVSAYLLRAARQQNQAELFHKVAVSLYQGAVLNQSNMENLEWLSQKAHVEDGALSGPVINSERQLWSVAAYGDLVAGQLFGTELKAGMLTINPYIPVDLARELDLGNNPVLQNLTLAGTTLDLQLELPPQARRGQVYRLAQLSLNGQPQVLTGNQQFSIKLSDFSQQRNELVLKLQAFDAPASSVTQLRTSNNAGPLHGLSNSEKRKLLAPKEPLLQLSLSEKGIPTLRFDAAGESDTRFTLYKNGVPVKLKPRQQDWTDSKAKTTYSQCYALTQSYKDSGLSSQPSRTLCTPGAAVNFVAGQGLLSADHEISDYLNQPVFKNWGAPEQQLQLNFSASHEGLHALRLQYFIDNGPINTGITAVVKRLSANCPQSGLQQATLVMPHLATALEAGWSSRAMFRAKAGEQCTVTISDGFNMSYLQHFNLYTGGKGGRTGPLNQAVIQQAQIQPMAE
jgi:hypothetical protein